MNDLTIKITDVSLKYRLARERPKTLQEYIVQRLKGKRLNYEDFWALRDINLEIRKGETLGLIGPNGAGKSTLLKVIAGILIPVVGDVTVNGKIAPLIELGSGFNMELTGKENIYLNSSILGLSRKEIDDRFERILAFSELGDFIYSPLRTYSSGMVARLGFSIATEVDPDILIIDEILSVGDEHFREKCDERILSFKEKGVTILFVSHNMPDIKKLCDKAICLKKGQIVFEGTSADTADFYMEQISKEKI
ncbi:MAG: ABC transporter ATP-binding protein [Nitrospirae bacterium]|nr:ABC transporter ATP-binding protein [Nitrospirota bacterium]